ncbi:hypothetical protein J6590_044888 [Homalodisca vitripennis]|nr:hypothetical protein J6590_044888 [Homalodisca vitripennis]
MHVTQLFESPLRHSKQGNKAPQKTQELSLSISNTLDVQLIQERTAQEPQFDDVIRNTTFKFSDSAREFCVDFRLTKFLFFVVNTTIEMKPILISEENAVKVYNSIDPAWASASLESSEGWLNQTWLVLQNYVCDVFRSLREQLNPPCSRDLVLAEGTLKSISEGFRQLNPSAMLRSRIFNKSRQQGNPPDHIGRGLDKLQPITIKLLTTHLYSRSNVLLRVHWIVALSFPRVLPLFGDNICSCNMQLSPDFNIGVITSSTEQGYLPTEQHVGSHFLNCTGIITDQKNTRVVTSSTARRYSPTKQHRGSIFLNCTEIHSDNTTWG